MSNGLRDLLWFGLPSTCHKLHIGVKITSVDISKDVPRGETPVELGASSADPSEVPEGRWESDVVALTKSYSWNLFAIVELDLWNVD
jgi:hypothetical protein